MLFTENLAEIIFNRHDLLPATDEIIILSGYVGPKPIERLQTLPIPSKVIYGMYGSEGVKKTLHNSLTFLQNNIKSIDIYYSLLPIHSKCYLWMNNGEVVHALVGSANFSTSGLHTPYREILAETTRDTFAPLNLYIKNILNNSISCLELEMNELIQESIFNNCSISLLGTDGEVQNYAGLNWGQSPKGHINRNDSYIAIRQRDLKDFPKLFPPKQSSPKRYDNRGRKHRHNDFIEIIWDDGVCMEGLLFGSQEREGIKYPKQIGSFPHYSEMGKYIRKRLGVPEGQPIRKLHLTRYGRDTINISLLNEGVYKFDFSVT